MTRTACTDYHGGRQQRAKGEKEGRRGWNGLSRTAHSPTLPITCSDPCESVHAVRVIRVPFFSSCSFAVAAAGGVLVLAVERLGAVAAECLLGLGGLLGVLAQLLLERVPAV